MGREHGTLSAYKNKWLSSRKKREECMELVPVISFGEQ
jgi:hypothetical protein